jgi:DHA1 family multidrug resistance protein-like MFS transporter
MWEVLIASVPVLALLLLWPETSGATILHQRAARLRKQTGNERIRTRAEIAHQHKPSAKDVVVKALLMPARITALDPAILFTNVYMMLVYGIYYSFFESFPLVWGPIYGFDLLQQNLAFIPFIVGTSVALLSYTAYLYYYRVGQQFHALETNVNTNPTAPSNPRRETNIPRTSPPPSHGQLLPPTDWDSHLRMDGQI